MSARALLVAVCLMVGSPTGHPYAHEVGVLVREVGPIAQISAEQCASCDTENQASDYNSQRGNYVHLVHRADAMKLGLYGFLAGAGVGFLIGNSRWVATLRRNLKAREG